MMPLAIIQARMNSKRFPGKVLMRLDGMTLLERAWRTACSAFGRDNVVIAHPATDGEIAAHADAMLAQRFEWNGDENDVLGRFHACAHTYRWRAESVLVRVTPDDPFKTVAGLLRVADGERLPVEIGGEAFTLAMLDVALDRYSGKTTQGVIGRETIERIRRNREHISFALFDQDAPLPPRGQVWTIDMPEDLAKAQKQIENGRAARLIVEGN